MTFSSTLSTSSAASVLVQRKEDAYLASFKKKHQVQLMYYDYSHTGHSILRMSNMSGNMLKVGRFSDCYTQLKLR